MSGLTMSRKHGLAPALLVCPYCGGDTGGIALLGARADTVMKELYERTGGRLGSARGYDRNRVQRVLSHEMCDKCKAALAGGGTIILADDGQALRLTGEELRPFLSQQVIDGDGNGVLQLSEAQGKVCRVHTPFWRNDDGTVAVRVLNKCAQEGGEDNGASAQ